MARKGEGVRALAGLATAGAVAAPDSVPRQMAAIFGWRFSDERFEGPVKMSEGTKTNLVGDFADPEVWIEQ